MPGRLFCPKCGNRYVPRSEFYCEYTDDKNGYYSGCGMRVAYNKSWHFCPVCGKKIAFLGKVKRERSYDERRSE